MRYRAYRPLVLALAALLAVLACCLPAGAATVTVGPTGNYTAVQEAIDHASPGDTIRIQPGTYREAIEVNKPLYLRSSGFPTQGRPRIDGLGEAAAVSVTAPGVRLDGLELVNGSENAVRIGADNFSMRLCAVEHATDHASHENETVREAAIFGDGREDVEVDSTTVTLDCRFGIALPNARNVTITSNAIREARNDGCTRDAVSLPYDEAGTYAGVRIENNLVEPGVIEIYRATDDLDGPIRLVGAKIGANALRGGFVQVSVDLPNEGTLLAYNELRDGRSVGASMRLRQATGATIEENEISGITCSQGFGIFVEGLHASVVRENVVRDSNLSIGIGFQRDNDEETRPAELEIMGNRATDCREVGMALYDITDSVLRGNVMERNPYNFYYVPIYTDDLPNMTIDATNLVDGRPILYYEGKSGVRLDAADRPGLVFFYDCRDVSVADVEFRNEVVGITLFSIENVTIRNCTFSDLMCAIQAIEVNGGRITGCRGTDLYYGAELLYETAGITVDRNVFDTAEGVSGIEIIEPGPGMRISDNTFSGFQVGAAAIGVDPADGLVMENNTHEGGYEGVALIDAQNVSVTGNRVSRQEIAGIMLSATANNTITGNRIEANSAGLLLNPTRLESGNVIANNYFNNSVQVLIPWQNAVSADQVLGPLVKSMHEGAEPLPSIVEERLNRTVRELRDRGAVVSARPQNSNVWKFSKSAGPNIVGGPYLGGNYWASPNGTGWSETHADRGDGFCAEPFVIDENNIDYLPLHLHAGPSPYVTHQVPCRIEAEDYDQNGYSDRTPGNTGGAYRHDDVDIEKGGSNYDVGWVKSSEWLEYTVQVDRAGLYAASFRTATPWDGRTILVSVDGAATGVVAVPRTGSFAKYTTVGSTMPLSAGTHHLRLRFVSDGQNLDFVDLAPVKEANFAASPTAGKRSLKVTFTDRSTGSPVKWQWSFGDGKYSTSTVRNPTWYYNRAGTYSVTLKVTYADGTTRTVTRPNLVTVR